MDIPTIPGAVYTISSASSCDVSDKASGQLLGTAEAGAPFTTPAYSDALTLSDPAALYVQIKTFNFALAALGLLGEGNSALPNGYLAAEFLGAIQNNQRVEFPLTWDNKTDSIYVAFSTLWPTPESGTYYLRPFGGTHSSGKIAGSYSLHATTYYTATRWYIRAFAPSGQLPIVDLVNGGVKNEVLLTSNTVLVNGVFKSVAYEERPTLTDTFQVPGWGLSAATYVNVLAFEHRSSGKANMSLVPALDAQGKPCLYDTIGRTSLYNSGSGEFIVGMTLEQASKLSKLPATDGSLTVALPTGYESDAGVANALETARSNGWTLTVQTYESETSAATFAVRRIWVRRTADENGSYVDTAGTRWQVDWCVDMLTPDGSTPDQHGYELFRSVDAAVEYWEIEPYVVPEEELLTEHNENE